MHNIMTPDESATAHERAQLEIEQIRANISKMIAEQAKLMAEQAKLARENKLGNFGVPAIATIVAASLATVLGACVTLAVAFLRHA